MKRSILFLLWAVTILSANALEVTIHGLNYFLDSKSHEAVITSGGTCSGELDIPSEVCYNGETFVVKSMIWKAFDGLVELTKVRIPKTLESIMHEYPQEPTYEDVELPYVFYPCTNPFTRCTSLESIEVDEENPGMKSVGGVLFSKDGTWLYAYPAGIKAASYDVPQGVTQVGTFALANENLKKIDLAESVQAVGLNICYDSSLDTLIIRGRNVEDISMRGWFLECLKDTAKLYVPASEVDRYKSLYSGTVLPLEEYEGRKVNQEYFPEGTKWTEIRLDTLKYDSWYSKVGDEWVPNFETIEYRVQGEHTSFGTHYKCVYNNDPDWAGQATFLIYEKDNNEVLVSLLVLDENGNESYTFVPSEIYQFNWSIGQWMWFQTPDETNTTVIFQKRYSYGIIDEIKEGYFGGVSPLKYVDLDGKAPDNPELEPKYVDTNGGRIIQGIGITEWNDGECLLGPINMYKYLDMWGVGRERHYRSMLVHFERDGEVLYDVWPRKGSTVEVAIDGLNYFLYLDRHEAVLTSRNNCSGEVDIPSEVRYNDETFVVKSMTHTAFHNNSELTKVRIPKTIEEIIHYYPVDPDWLDPPTGMANPIYVNPFKGCTALESIEVDEENPCMKSIDGVLFSQDGVGQYYYKTGSYSGTGLYCYPEGVRQESYTIPESVEWIGGAAFPNNQYLTTLTIPNSMKHICYDAFSGCCNLTDVYCYAENVPIAWDGAFRNVPIASATLHVPAGSIEEYKTTSPWSNFGNIVALPDNNSYYYYYKGNKIPLALNENKVVVSIPKECDETSERIQANVQVLTTIKDNYFDIIVISRSDYEHLTSMDSWEEDERNVVLSSCYFTERNDEVCASPYLNVKIKKEQDTDLLNAYVEQYKLRYGDYKPLITLWYVLSVTPETEKDPLQVANELYESGDFAVSVPDLVDIEPEPLEPVTFTEGQMATIVLPTEPDASKGKYYRLDRVEGNEIIFEQELQPRAHVPYIIVPNEDFSIEVDALELDGLRSDTASVEGISFIGTYQKDEVESQEGFYIELSDTTPDCSLSPSGEAGRDVYTIGALRAYLLVHWDDPYSHGGTKTPAEKLEIVLHDDATGIESIQNSKFKVQNEDAAIYDVSGKPVNRKSLSRKSTRGIYIQDGKKVAFKQE